jgi:hypothetical protein
MPRRPYLLKKRFIRVDKGDGTETQEDINALIYALKGSYKNPELIADELKSGKIPAIQTPFAIWRLKK